MTECNGVPARIFSFVLFLIVTASGRGMDNRPNILFIMADDHAWRAVSAYGEARNLIQAHNIDRLAREGIRFDRCLVCNSLWAPSRASVVTGTYSHINGFSTSPTPASTPPKSTSPNYSNRPATRPR